MSLENMMEPTGELSSEQIGAIRHSVRIGSLLVNDHPETGERYAVEGGIKLAAEGKGVHGLTPEQRLENGRKSAESINPETGLRYVVEGGIKTAAEGKGIHGLTPEQRLENARKGTLAQGKTPWEKEETEWAHVLSLDPEFQHQKGPHKGKGDYKTIAQVLNEDYHNGEEVRSQQSVKKNLFRYIKTLGN